MNKKLIVFEGKKHHIVNRLNILAIPQSKLPEVFGLAAKNHQY